jgi:two-component system, chemotaxis family, sensor histidine kinase and response regulator PixL
MAELDPRDEAYQCFVQEAVEHLQGLELGLLNLQQDHSAQRINQLMRYAHSLKGGASLFGLTATQDLAHNLENVFKLLYSQTHVIDPELEEVLLQVYDCLREPLMDQIERQVYAPALAVARSKPLFAALEARFGQSLSEAVSLPDPDFAAMLQGLEAEFPDMVLAAAEAEAQSNLMQVLDGLETAFPEALAFPEMIHHGAHPQVQPQFQAQEQFQAPQEDTEQRQLLAQILEAEVESFASLQQANLGAQRQQILIGEVQKFAEMGEYFTLPGLVKIAEIAAAAMQRCADPAKAPADFNADFDKVSYLLLADLRQTQIQLANTDSNAQIGPAALLALSAKTAQPAAQPGTLPSQVEDEPDPMATIIQFASNSRSQATQTAPKSVAQSAAKSVPPLPPESAAAISPGVPATVAAPATVRVEVARLEALNNLTGELVTLDNGLLLQQQQYKTLSERLKRWQDEFKQFGRRMTDDAVLTVSPELLTQLQDLNPGSSRALFEDNNGDGVGFAREVIQQVTEQVLETVMQVVTHESFKLDEILQDFAATNKLHKSILTKQEQSLKQVQSNLLQARMVPLQDLLNRFPRMVRDLGVRHEKQVNLTIPTQPIMVDKMMVEKLYDPLLHLIRNAFDHGIESPEVREQRGKASQGQIQIEAYHRGNFTWIEIKDDGQGIKLSKIRAKLLQLNLCTPDQVNCLSPEELYEYLFAPGFTTTEVTTELSGRGVGLDAVRLQVEALQGQISVTSELGVGTTFTLRLPYNMSVTQLLVFTVNGGGMAIPVKDLVTVTTVKTDKLEQQGSQWFYRNGDKLLPIITNLQRSTHARSERQLFGPNMGIPAKEDVTLLIVADRAEELAILIDQTLMQQDLMVKSFGNLVKTPHYITGCTILGDGRLITVLDGAELIAAWQTWLQGPAKLAPALAALTANPVQALRVAPNGEASSPSNHLADDPEAPPSLPDPTVVVAPPTILVVDDSMTIRQNLSVFLRRSGYQVIQASDGLEGLERLQQNAVIHAVISDVDMPNMNGLEFLRNCRQSFSIEQLPVIMLTSRNTDNYRQLAKRLGASAYLGKPYLEAELLQTLKNLMPNLMPLASV